MSILKYLKIITGGKKLVSMTPVMSQTFYSARYRPYKCR